MKRKLLLSFLGFICAFLVGMGVHYRNEAIRRYPPLKLDSDNTSSNKKDFANDIRRIRDEVYDPVRPVATEGSALLTLEKAAYAAPGAAISSLLSPVLLPALAYPQQFHQSHRYRLPLGASLPPDLASSAELEGSIWGVCQSAAFYLPFFILRKKRDKASQENSSQENRTTA